MKFEESYHVNFILAAEFREKVKRTKEDFGTPGFYFSCETLRGIYDFTVSDQSYFDNVEFDPFDVLLISGRLAMRTGRLLLQASEFVKADTPDAMNEAQHLVESGLVSGNVFTARKGYQRREDDTLVRRVECKCFGFSDSFIDPDLYTQLPADGSSVVMKYQARLALDTTFERRADNLNRRSTWLLSNQKVEPLRSVRRESRERKEEVTK